MATEAEAAELLAGKHLSGRLKLVQLESALCVLKREACEHPHHKVEELSRPFAQKMLMHFHT